MSHIEHQVHISASADRVFDAFTRYVEYPNFMKSVDQVRVDDNEPDLLHWHLSLATVPRIIVTRVNVDREAQRVEWRSEKGIENSGTVTLRSLDSGDTELSMVVDFEPEGFLESVGDELGLISHRIEADLTRFAAYIQSAGDQAEGSSSVTDALGKGGTPSNQLTERITPGGSGQ
jgi:uncharacterized membrane protein